LWLIMALKFASRAELAVVLISGSLRSIGRHAQHQRRIAIVIGIAAMRLFRRPQTLRIPLG
jgi:hypothetical protein